MTKKLFFYLIFASAALSSCSQVVDNYMDQEALKNYVSPYQGTWLGNYSGEQSGTLKVSVSKSGSTEITRISGDFSESFFGMVYDDGTLSGATSPTSGFELSGRLNNGSQNNGIWKQSGISGNWKVIKH